MRTTPGTAISIVVPSLESPTVGRTLASLAAEGAPGPGREIVVVGRDSRGLVPRETPGLVFLETPEPLNPAAARNLGVAHARGAKILFVDADCAVRPGWIAALSAALDQAPVAGGAVDFPRDGNVWALADNIASFHELLADRPGEDDTRGVLGSLNLGVRREVWDELGGFDPELTTSEDFDWVLRARARGFPTAFVPAAVVEHGAVRDGRAELAGHARWYGRNFHDFRRRHPAAFAGGPTWRSRGRLAVFAPLKSVTSALAIFRAHPRALAACWRALPGVILFKGHWYRAVLETWPEKP